MLHPERIIVTLNEQDAGKTLVELARQLVGDEESTQIVTHGGVWLNRRRVDMPEEVRALVGDELTLRRPPQRGYAKLEITASDICYEDTWLIALHKHAGWYSSVTPWDIHGNIPAALARYLAARDGSAPPLHLAHRLDRDTSGVLLLSKDSSVNAPLLEAFRQGKVEKSYLGMCQGVPNETGEIQSGHGRARGGRWRLYELDEIGKELPADGGYVKSAHTSYQLLEKLHDAALFEARPYTGRTHQIRLHMAYIGHPLLGDERYGGPKHYFSLDLPVHLLHAATLTLPHPVFKTRFDLHSPLPPLFTNVSEAGRS
jgi:23S rRNA pseudouridine1911/1915/1917 synthase